ncbi:MAG: sigma 54-interacting transcriptional regulator, partial [Deltaproteobacteria bacterium]|nr:sigma 54-interacting transcriptional regulator [Deltaproteobacteria bacterium]
FVTINCAGIPESLLESELFGYERGAFTGADQAKAGKIELAHGGTLFLDEIESMSPTMQAKLLRVLEAKKVQRLGGSQTVHIDMRVVSASNIPVENLVAQGKMRCDFYYRIGVIVINLNPLCQRREDIPLLVHDFFHHHPVAASKQVKVKQWRGEMTFVVEGKIDRDSDSDRERERVRALGTEIKKLRKEGMRVKEIAELLGERGFAYPRERSIAWCWKGKEEMKAGHKRSRVQKQVARIQNPPVLISDY